MPQVINFTSDATLRKFIADVGKYESKFKSLKAEAESLMSAYSKFFMDIDPDSRHYGDVENAYNRLRMMLSRL